jgi:hypothetical protein
MSASYSKFSPYRRTARDSGYLDLWTPPSIPFQTDDMFVEIQSKYHHRPDLLAYDLYDTVGLWWVFAMRNPEIIKDPIFDLVSGSKIYLPKISTIHTALGI